MESVVHSSLKAKSAALLRHLPGSSAPGLCCAAATEVICPIARFRVDVAGYADPLPRDRGLATAPHRAASVLLERGPRPRTIIIECKQSRADFLSDSADRDELLAQRDHLTGVRKALEDRIIKVCEPELRQSGSALFDELETWDFARSRVPSYRRIVRELRTLDARLHGSSKFWTLAHYRLADALYIAAPAGLIRPRELPEGWGLLEIGRAEAVRDDACEDAWRITQPAPLLEGKELHRRRLLRNIAVALSRRQG